MTKSKSSVYSHKKHKKIIKKSKGYYGSRSKTYKSAKQSVIKSKQYSYIGRKLKKRRFRKLWIIKINAESRKYGINYSKLINLLKNKSIIINRKIISNIAQFNKKDFSNLINIINK